MTYISCHTGHCYRMYMLHRYYDTSLYYFVFICHRHIDAPLHERPTFHIIFLIITCLLGTQLCHVYTSRFHLTLVLHVHEAHIYSPVYMHGLCLYSCHMDPCSCYMSYCSMLLYSCCMIVFPLLILLFPLLDTCSRY